MGGLGPILVGRTSGRLREASQTGRRPLNVAPEAVMPETDALCGKQTDRQTDRQDDKTNKLETQRARCARPRPSRRDRGRMCNQRLQHFTPTH